MSHTNNSAVFAATAILALALGIQDTGDDKHGPKTDMHVKSSTQLKIEGKTGNQIKFWDAQQGKASTQLKSSTLHKADKSSVQQKSSTQIRSDATGH